MSLKLGDLDISKSYLGDIPINKIYLGESLVYTLETTPSGPTTIEYLTNYDYGLDTNNPGQGLLYVNKDYLMFARKFGYNNYNRLLKYNLSTLGFISYFSPNTYSDGYTTLRGMNSNYYLITYKYNNQNHIKLYNNSTNQEKAYKKGYYDQSYSSYLSLNVYIDEDYVYNIFFDAYKKYIEVYDMNLSVITSIPLSATCSIMDSSERYIVFPNISKSINGFSNNGEVYVHDKQNNFSLIRTIQSPYNKNNVKFGTNLVINGKYLAVTSHFSIENDSGTKGTVDVYDVESGNRLYTIDNPNINTDDNYDHFGHGLYTGLKAMCIGDGFLAISAKLEDDPLFDSGVVYIYNLYSGELINIIHNKNDYGTTEGDQFGYDIDAYGQYLAILARYEDKSKIDLGRVYLYKIY